MVLFQSSILAWKYFLLENVKVKKKEANLTSIKCKFLEIFAINW